jgi:NurA-like 5'-3' nuclease
LKKDILDRAAEMWREYRPLSRKCMLVGVDSSYNKRHFLGFHLYAIDAVGVKADGAVVAKRYESKIRAVDQRQLEVRAMAMESEVAAEAGEQADLVLIDGSMLARFVLASNNAVKSLNELTRRHSNVFFISKSSDTREIFRHMNSKVGDIYYFNRVGDGPGYSRPYCVTRYEEKYQTRVTVVFARLSDYTPVIKLEFPGEVHEDHIGSVIDKIASESISGYPYVLKLAHNSSLVTDDDIERLVSIYGLKNEIGAREVLR